MEKLIIEDWERIHLLDTIYTKNYFPSEKQKPAKITISKTLLNEHTKTSI